MLQVHLPVESQVVPEDPEASQPQAKYDFYNQLINYKMSKIPYLDKHHPNYSMM